MGENRTRFHTRTDGRTKNELLYIHHGPHVQTIYKQELINQAHQDARTEQQKLFIHL
jgi:hypothetical protein